MAFKIHMTDDGHVPAWEYLPAAAMTPKVGLALAFSGGKLAVATGKPEYICMRDEETAVTAGTMIPVIAVNPGITFATEATAALTSVNEGDAVTLAATGLGITATKTDGVATIVSKAGEAVGSEVLVKFK